MRTAASVASTAATASSAASSVAGFGSRSNYGGTPGSSRGLSARAAGLLPSAGGSSVAGSELMLGPGGGFGGGSSDGGGDNVRVVVRVRPTNDRERERCDPEVVVANGNYATVAVTVPTVDSGGGPMETVKQFSFDRCFDGGCAQQRFFEESGITKLLDSTMDGYAATVFAYGQTGSGKTYTMSGVEQRIERDDLQISGDPQAGVIPRAVRYLFEGTKAAERSEPGSKYTIKASYCEIYNEQVFDLLHLQREGGGCLQVRWNVTNGFFVKDLIVVECSSAEDLLAVVSEGHRNRRIGSHEMNKDSSRSHSLLTVHVEAAGVDSQDGHALVRYGKIVFVDLAGSERLKDTKSEGATLTETGAINKSLFTLGKVISTLSSAANASSSSSSSGGGGKGGGGRHGGGGSSHTHVPYRDSLLTKLLMDSLGGSSMALMVACCSPAQSYLDETLSTLKYARRAGCIANRPIVNVDASEQLIYSLKQENRLLRLENSYLREQMGIGDGQQLVLPSGMASAGARMGGGGGGGAMIRGVGSSGGGGVNLRPFRQQQQQISGPGGEPISPLAPSDPRMGGRAMHLGSSAGGSGMGAQPPQSPRSQSINRQHQQQMQQMQQMQLQGGGMSAGGMGGGGGGSPGGASGSEQGGGAGYSARHHQKLQEILMGYQREAERLKSENRDLRGQQTVTQRA